MAIGAACDLPAVDLARATRLLVVVREEQGPLDRRAAACWLSRYTTETRELTPAMLANVADALAALEHSDLDAAERLMTAVSSTARTVACGR